MKIKPNSVVEYQWRVTTTSIVRPCPRCHCDTGSPFVVSFVTDIGITSHGIYPPYLGIFDQLQGPTTNFSNFECVENLKLWTRYSILDTPRSTFFAKDTFTLDFLGTSWYLSYVKWRTGIPFFLCTRSSEYPIPNLTIGITLLSL